MLGFVVAASLALDSGGSAQGERRIAPPVLRCFEVDPALTLGKGDVAAIKSAIRISTGRPVLRIEPPNSSDHPPRRALQVITLLRGDCDSGEGQRLWIRKGRRGWRVI